MKPLERSKKSQKPAPTASSNAPHLFLFVLESFRSDVLGPETTPHLWSFSKEAGVLPKRCHECEDKKYREKLARQQKRYRDKKAAEKQA
jgi:hypothetical protein